MNRWWIRLPRYATRLSRPISATLADGHFLAAWPVLGTIATPAALLTGLLFGALRIGYYRSFSESLTLVLVAVAFGFVAGQLGAAFVAGFAVGDFFIGQTSWIFHSSASGIMGNGLIPGLLRIRVPMLIAYLVLLSLAVALPALIRRLLQNLPGVNRLPSTVGFGVAVVLNVVLVYLGVRLYVNAAAVLIRPLYTWSVRLTLFGHPIPPERVVAPEAVQTFQRDGVWIIRVAIIATLVRFLFVWLTLQVPALRARLEAVERGLAQPATDRPLIERYGPWPALIASAIAGTLMLGGLIEVWWVAALFFVELLLLRALTAGLVPPRVNRWRRLVAHVPLVLRLAVALLTVQTLASAFVGRTSSFTPMAVFVAAAVAVLYLLAPGEPRKAAT
jgi:hypothetical protein